MLSGLPYAGFKLKIYCLADGMHKLWGYPIYFIKLKTIWKKGKCVVSVLCNHEMSLQMWDNLGKSYYQGNHEQGKKSEYLLSLSCKRSYMDLYSI